jgi:hypothetical protein
LDPVVSGNPLRQFQYCVMTGSTSGSFPMNPASIKRLSADGTEGKTKFYARTESPEYESIQTLFNEESDDEMDHLFVNTGSRMEGRRWPADHCAKVLRSVDERIDVEFGLIGGPTDTDRLRAIEKKLPRSISVVPWYEKTDALIKDVYLSDCADLTVSTDSGPQHLISLRGNPVLDVAGDMWVGPWNRDSLVVRDESGDISQLNVDQVAEGIVRLLGGGDSVVPSGDDTTNWYAPRRPVEDLWFRHLPVDSNLDTDHELSSLLSLWLWSKLARQHGWQGLPFAVRDGREILDEWSVKPAEDTSVEDLNIVGREFLGEEILRQAGDILDCWRRG